jgi:putative phage-type endonuclease
MAIVYRAADFSNRTLGLGGSDVAKALGLSPWGDSFSLWEEKTGITPPADLGGNENIYWGLRLESLVIDEFKLRNPELDVQTPDTSLVSTIWPWAYATTDAVVLDNNDQIISVIEAKTTSDAGFISQFALGVIPLVYRCQAVHYMAVTGAKSVWFCVLARGNRYMQIEIKRSDEEISHLMGLESQFWQLVEDNTPPKPKDEPELNLQTLSYDTDTELLSAIDDYQDTSRQIKELETAKKAHGELIKKRIDTSDGLLTDEYQIRWLRTAQNRFDKAAFKAENLKLYEQYNSVTTCDLGLRIKKIR